MKEWMRRACKEDIPGMVRLLGQLFSLEADFDFHPELHSRALERIVCADGSGTLALVFVPYGKAEVMGMLTVQTVVSTATGELSGWVEDVVVDPSWQGKGVGKALLEEAESWALGNGVNRLQLLADKDNSRALEFYKSRGWTGSSLVHRKKMILPVQRGS